MIFVPYTAAGVALLIWGATMAWCLRPMRRARQARRLAQSRARRRLAAGDRGAAAQATGRLCPICGYDMDGHATARADAVSPADPYSGEAFKSRLVAGNLLATAVARPKVGLGKLENAGGGPASGESGASRPAESLPACPECGGVARDLTEYYRPRVPEAVASMATALLVPGALAILAFAEPIAAELARLFP
jgi:hypothetical protein